MVSDDELMTGYRRFGQRLEGHPTPGAAVGRRRDRLAGPGPARRRRRRARRQVPRPAAVPGLGAVRRQRDGRGIDVGGPGQGLLLRAVQPDRDRRRQPARPARPDRARLGPGRVRPPRRGVRRPGADHRRPRSRARSTRRWPRPSDPTATGRRSSWPGPSRAAASPRSRTATTGTASRFPPDMAERAIAELGGERNLIVRGPPPGAGSSAPPSTAPPGTDRPLPALRDRRQGGHP